MDIQPFDFNRHREQAVNRFREIRGTYKNLAETVQRILKEALTSSNIVVHSIEARAKTLDSFGIKASKPSPSNPEVAKYNEPLKEITDLAAARIITFFPGDLLPVCTCIEKEFLIQEKIDKADKLMEEGKFGYHSIHFIATMNEQRTRLSEYQQFNNLSIEIQVRTILQHAWAEMEHDIQYKSVSVIPTAIRRRFVALAGMLEIADREFQSLQEEDKALRVKARELVDSGHFSGVEITPDSLKTYLDRRFGPDGRLTNFSYEFSANLLEQLGFTTMQQIEECLNDYDADSVSRAIWGSRQGQLSRLDDTLLAAMGSIYTNRHPWSSDPFWSNTFQKRLKLLANKKVSIGSYDPRQHKEPTPNSTLPKTK